MPIAATLLRSRCLARAACLLLALFVAEPVRAADPPLPKLQVLLPRDAARAPITGRLYLFLSQRDRSEPMRGPDWFNPEPFFRLDVADWRPGESQTIDSQAHGFPTPLAELPPGRYRAQAILDHDFHRAAPSQGDGNLYSPVIEIDWPGGQNPPAPPPSWQLELNQVIRREIPADTQWVKRIALKSDRLSAFHNREVAEYAAVVLPASYYDQPQRRYPVLFIIPGFGGDERDAWRFAAAPPQPADGEVELLRVFLSGQCKWGHHVYADSATNGPRGQALIHELIPHLDREFRTIAAPTARFLAGHSSGGWSSLWLQVKYPDVFGGVWSSSPDPVDFRDFQQIDLYADPPANVYKDAAENRRPIARLGDRPVLWFDSFCRMDDTLGRGGQLRSFEAVFSPLDAQGLPARLWYRRTGQVDPLVAKSWQAYDISLLLKRDWPTLQPQLAGKLHVTMGDLDTFYLDGATRRLADRLRELKSDAQITFVAGASHSSLLTPEYYARVRREIAAAFLARHPAK